MKNEKMTCWSFSNLPKIRFFDCKARLEPTEDGIRIILSHSDKQIEIAIGTDAKNEPWQSIMLAFFDENDVYDNHAFIFGDKDADTKQTPNS